MIIRDRKRDRQALVMVARRELFLPSILVPGLHVLLINVVNLQCDFLPVRLPHTRSRFLVV